MSLHLNMGTEPDGLRVKTRGFGKDIVFIGEYEVSIEDFFVLAHYVLTNTNLREDDPRLRFVESVKAMIVFEGFNRGGKRLSTAIPPIQADDALPPTEEE